MKQNSQQINLAGNLSRLRKKHGMTQDQLAKLLFVSNKTVSKWERGIGYPELPQLLRLSDVLGVTVDQLITGEKNGIMIAGNLLTDFVKRIDMLPKNGMLSTISSISRAVGGCVPNTAIDLAIIDRTLPVSAAGKVGDDEDGKYVTMELQKHGIDVSGVSVSRTVATGFSDVMTLESTGERTFFHHRGANTEFSPEDVCLALLNCRMLHIGYIYVLDRFDEADSEYGTVMARFLHDLQERGIETSIDAVSDSKGEFASKIIPALKYTDNAILNEIEGCGVSGLPPRDENGKLIVENIRRSMELFLSHGVRARAIFHAPEGGFILNRNGDFTAVPSLKLPKGYIKGTVGAGDAFCAGCLYGIYHGYSDREILEFASAAAACNLSADDSVSGMRSKEEIMELLREMPRRESI